jgi:hypothetical protein
MNGKNQAAALSAISNTAMTLLRRVSPGPAMPPLRYERPGSGSCGCWLKQVAPRCLRAYATLSPLERGLNRWVWTAGSGAGTVDACEVRVPSCPVAQSGTCRSLSHTPSTTSTQMALPPHLFVKRSSGNYVTSEANLVRRSFRATAYMAVSWAAWCPLRRG